MDRDSTASDSQRLVYRGPAYLWIGLPLLALGLFLVSGSLFSLIMHWLNSEPIFGKHGFQSILFGYVLEFVILALGIRFCTERQVVLDREYHRITKTKKILFWDKSEVHDARSFDTVSWRSESKSDGEDRFVRYPITLSGSSGRIDLFVENSQEQALRTVAEIEKFLQIQQKQDVDVYVPAQGEINVSKGTAIHIVRVFSFLWYLICGVFVVVGLAFAGGAGWATLQGKMEVGAGLAFVGGSLLFTTVAVVFIFTGRKLFPAQMEAMKREVAREQAARTSAKAETAQQLRANESDASAESARSSTLAGSAGSVEAGGRKYLKWVAIALGLMIGCESQVVTTLEGEEVALRNRLIFLWSSQPSATELAKELDRDKYAKIGVSRVFGFGIYSSSSTASIPGAKRKSRQRESNPTKQALHERGLYDRWIDQAAQLKSWATELGGTARANHPWHHGTQEVEMDFEVDLRQTQVSDHDLKLLAERELQAEIHLGGRLFRRGLIQSLNLSGCQITAEGISYLKDMNSLTVLRLNDLQITDEELVLLDELPEMNSLYLERTNITDAGLVSLTKLSRIAYLSLSGTQVTDLGIEHLRELSTLKKLELVDCQLTAKGVEELRRALSNCEIIDQ